MCIFHVQILLIYHTLTVRSQSQGVYFDDGSCEYVQEKVHFGGGNAGVFLKIATSYPAVFVCRWEEPSGKWLRFRVNKAEGPFHQADPISLFLGSAFQCEPGAKFSADSFKANQKIGELTPDDSTFPAMKIRVADALSNPASNVGCLIAWCQRTRRGCMSDFNVEFYDQFAKGAPVHPVLFGLGWADLLLAIVLFFELIASTTFIMSFFFKYNVAYQKLYRARKNTKNTKNTTQHKPKSSKKKSKRKRKKKSKSKRRNDETYENDE